MKNNPQTFNIPGSQLLAKGVIVSSLFSIISLLVLHFVSPEFDSSWRMASEYALGNHKWLISLFFIFWGISSWCLAILLWNVVTTKLGKTGVIILFISGIGEVLAALFDVKHSLHGLAGLLGIPTLPVATLLISYHLKSKDNWKENKTLLLLSAHSTWLSLVLMIITMIVMIVGFQNAGVEFSENSEPPKVVPNGVIAIAGYANRLLILAYIFWLMIVAKAFLKINQKQIKL